MDRKSRAISPSAFPMPPITSAWARTSTRNWPGRIFLPAHVRSPSSATIPTCRARATTSNQEDRVVPASLPRVDFFHWVLIDLPAAVNTIKEGEFSSDVTPRGKPGPQAAQGARQGVNNYTDWFAGDNDMRGDYHGYDGPCPPWNDEIVHRYVFTVYALDIEQLPLTGRFGGPEVRAAMHGHILAEASLTGTYTLNPKLGA